MKKVLGGALLALAAAVALAEEDAVVITATRVPQPSLEIPASVDRIYADEIREGRPTKRDRRQMEDFTTPSDES